MFEWDQDLCFERDSHRLISGRRQTLKEWSGLKRARLGALISAGLSAPSPLTRLIELYPVTREGAPLAGTWTLLKDYLPTDPESVISAESGDLAVGVAAGLVAFSLKCSMPIREVVALAQPFVNLAAKLPDSNSTLPILTVGTHELRILSRDFDGKAPWLDAIAPAQIAMAAARPTHLVGKVDELARALGALGAELPLPHDVSPTPALTERQLSLLSPNLGSVGPWLDTITPVQLALAAAKWSLTIGEVIFLARPLADLGVKIPDLGHIPPDLRFNETQIELLSRHLTGLSPWLDGIMPAHLIRAAAVWSMPFREVADLARPLSVLGIELPDLDATFPDPVLTDQERRLLSWQLDGEGDWLDTIVPARLARAAAEWTLPLGEVAKLAKPLVAKGVELSAMPPEAERWLEDRAVIQSLGFLNGEIDWDEQYLDPLDMAYRCVETKKDPEEFRDALALLKALEFDVDECIAYAAHCAAHAQQPPVRTDQTAADEA